MEVAECCFVFVYDYPGRVLWWLTKGLCLVAYNSQERLRHRVTCDLRSDKARETPHQGATPKLVFEPAEPKHCQPAKIATGTPQLVLNIKAASFF